MFRKISRFQRLLIFSLSLILGFFLTIGLQTQQTAVSLESSNLNIEQQARNFYQAGNFEASAQVWREILNYDSSEKDKLRQIMAWGNLSLCFQKLGQWEEANTAIQNSLELLQSFGNSKELNVLTVSAQTLSIQANLYFYTGEYAKALDYWKTAETQYKQLSNQDGITRSLLNQVQALQGLGLYRRAEITLLEIENSLKTQPNLLLKKAQLLHLSNILRVLGKLGEIDDINPTSCDFLEPKVSHDSELSATAILRQTLEIAKQLQSAEDIRQTQFSLANTARAIYQREQELGNKTAAEQSAKIALNCYQQAATSSHRTTSIRARLGFLNLLLESAQDSDVFNQIQSQLEFETANWQIIESQINTLSPGRTAVYARINLAQILMNLGRKNPDLITNSERILLTAIEQANSLGDPRIQSYALGYLGQLYEQRQVWNNAKQYTQKAILLSQSIQADEISYQWQWQLGRILKNQQPAATQSAISAYSGAVQSLQSLRKDLVAIRQDVQFDFRDRVEPVYREFVDLLLQSETPTSENLKQAQDVIESLQLAELDNFFQDACLDAKPQAIDKIDPNAVVIYGIILTDRLEIIASLPQTPLFHYRTSVPRTELTQTLEKLRKTLQQPYAYQEIQQLSQQVYRWLLEPLEPQLTEDKTLVFVLDGELRNIPMAALFDGTQYLIEKHPVVIAPGLQLLDPKPLIRPLNALSAGLVEPPEDFQEQFAPLPNIPQELQKIEEVGVESEALLNEEFNRDNLEKQATSNQFQVIHLATHGQFSSQAEKTFILAADGPINIKQLDNLFRSREQNQTRAIDLLVLSACETAPGDNRAVLGLAGVAVRAGARSTIASLWSLNDKSATEFMGHFYEQLVQGKSRAEALRQAQLAFLKDEDRYDAPVFWAPYVLVGNWR